MKYFWTKYQKEMTIVKEPVSIDINTTEKLNCDTSEEFYSCAQPQPMSSPIRKYGKNNRCNPDGNKPLTIKCLNQSIYIKIAMLLHCYTLDITFGLIDLDDFGIDSNVNETLSEVSFIF